MPPPQSHLEHRPLEGAGWSSIREVMTEKMAAIPRTPNKAMAAIPRTPKLRSTRAKLGPKRICCGNESSKYMIFIRK